ncbi:helix-turn-helix transcriptional regulator [Desulfatibacillum aliphaticivorans]|uniref:helix-turn-helix transcriptional regulator n=1 Tax=Desulfatibacillum aliphaticivorans TaxID=218208 RepID=UPI0003FDFB26|nr:transcriptional regulator [Desulfatibacillum aliphaticivorans]
MEQEKVFLNEKEVSTLTGFALSTLRNWRSLGHGPAYHKVSARAIRYEKGTVLAFMENHKIEPRNAA